MKVDMFSGFSSYLHKRQNRQTPTNIYDVNFNVGEEPVVGFSRFMNPIYDSDFNIYGTKENQQFYQRLRKNYEKMIFESRFYRPDRYNDITSAYKACLDIDKVINPRAEEVLNRICLNTQDERSGIFRERGFEGIRGLFMYARDHEGKINNKNLDFILYLDKNFEVNDFILRHAQNEVREVLDACRDENGICTDERVNIFKKLYENHYFRSDSYERSKLRKVIDGFCPRATSYYQKIGSNKKEEYKTSQEPHYHSYNTGSRYNETRRGWTREQFVNHIETRLSNQNMRKSFLKDTEVRNLAKLLGITTDKVLNLSRSDYRTLCKKFHPDTCKVANGDACFRIVHVLFKLK